jgi:hypothetical protein
LGFGKGHAGADRAFRELNRTFRTAEWKTNQDVLAAYPGARPIKGGRVVFNIIPIRLRHVAPLESPLSGHFSALTCSNRMGTIPRILRQGPSVIYRAIAKSPHSWDDSNDCPSADRSTTIDVIVEERRAEPTGIYDQHGVMIYRVPVRRRIGF